MNIWILLLICLPAFVFWIMLKIIRLRLYTYLYAKFPEEHSRYPGFSSLYLHEIFKPRKMNDKHYHALIRLNRRIFIMTSSLIIITIYALIKLR